MLNYNEYTSCLDTRLYKSGREIGVTSHRRRDSRGDDKVLPFLPHSQLPPQTFCTSLLDSFHVTFILINSISFFLIENRKCYTFGDHFNVHFVAPEIKRFEIYRFSFGSHLQWKFVRNHIDSCQCCLSRVRNRFNQSLNLCSQDLICTI